MQTTHTNNPFNWIWLVACSALLLLSDLLIDGYASLPIGFLLGGLVWLISYKAGVNLFLQVLLGLGFVLAVSFLSSGFLWGICGLADFQVCDSNQLHATIFANFAFPPMLILTGILGEGCSYLSGKIFRLFHKNNNKVKH